MKTWVGLIGVAVIVASVQPVWAITTSNAGLFLPGSGTPTVRVHPADDAADGNAGMWGTPFNVYTNSGLDVAGFSFVTSLQSAFASSSGPLGGILRSEVWRYDGTVPAPGDGHLLFAYQLENTGTAGYAYFRDGNIRGYEQQVAVVDSGILDYDGNESYGAGDVLRIGRAMGGTEQLFFSFEGYSSTGQWIYRPLEPGQTSSWFYVETDAIEYRTSVATIKDGGLSADQIPVLVPLPEPLTIVGVLAGMASLGTYLRRRRKSPV